MKCTAEELSLLIEIRDALIESRGNADVDLDTQTKRLPDAVTKVERSLFMLERNFGNVEDALVDIAEAFDELAKSVGMPSHIGKRARGILRRRRLR